MAMAMPASATTFACTPVSFMITKVIRIASGSMAEISRLARRCSTITSTTAMVTSTCSDSACRSVPSVSLISPLRS